MQKSVQSRAETAASGVPSPTISVAAATVSPQTFTFEQAKSAVARLDAELTRASGALDAFAKTGPMGLTPDAVRATPEWKRAKREFDIAFADLRKFNAMFVKIFAKELRDERRARRAA